MLCVLRIDTVNLVNVQDSKLRLFRQGQYPPYRGSFLSLSEDDTSYIRGLVYETYPMGS